MLTIAHVLDKSAACEANLRSNQTLSKHRTIIGQKGAAFTAACMCACQDAPVGILMYYDVRPTVFNGLFDYYTLAPLKDY